MRLFLQGLDTISLLGSNIVSNDNFIFISANGYNIYNGMIFVLYNNITIDNSNNILYSIHSIIESPEQFNTNFGLIGSASNKYLAVTAIARNIYQGAVHIYVYKYNRWLYLNKITDPNNLDLAGFGINIKLTPDNQLVISNYNNQVYIYQLENNDIKQINFEQFDTKISFSFDNFQNIFFSTYPNTIFVKNLLNNNTQIYSNNLQNDCINDNYIFVYDKTLFLSCANIAEPKIFVYKIMIESLELLQIIQNPSNDIFFGTHLDSNNQYLIISGTNCVYQYEKKFDWELKNKYVLPNSYVNYDYKIKILNDLFIVGNYGYNELEGGVFISKLTQINNPSYIINSDISVSKNIFISIVSIIFVILVGSMLTIIITLLCYFIVKISTPTIDIKKKKNEEEDYSPYKVYSYLGYNETDDQEFYYVQHPVNSYYSVTSNYPVNTYYPVTIYPDQYLKKNIDTPISDDAIKKNCI
jgi:hypothetical protein